MPRSERKSALTSPVNIEIYKQWRSRYNGMRSDFYKLIPIYMAIIGGLWSYAFSTDQHVAFSACLLAISFIGVAFCAMMFDYGIELSVYESKISKFEKFDPLSESASKLHYNIFVGGRAENVVAVIFLANAVIALVILYIISDSVKAIFTSITVTMVTVILAAIIYCTVYRLKTGRFPISKGKLVGWSSAQERPSAGD